jgi:peptidoglycan/LPS O-acetylase OafA/YrhL
VPFKLGYRPELDGLRAVAVCSVLLVHSSVATNGADFQGTGAGLPLLLSGGFLGVDIFFVLSGFLITTILLGEWQQAGAIDFRAFYIRRALRLSPAMILTLIAATIYVRFFRPEGSHFDMFAVAVSALYVSNFALVFAGLRLGMLTPTWSLSVEEQFYSLWPLTLTTMLRRSRKTVVHWTIGLAIGAAILRLVLYIIAWKTLSWPWLGAANHLIFARMDSLLCGALVAMAAAWGGLDRLTARQWRIAAWIAMVVLAILMVVSEPAGASLFYYGYAVTAVASAVLIAALVVSPPRLVSVVLRSKPFVWTGKISYGLYLYHMPIFVLMPWPSFQFLPHAVAPYAMLAVAIVLSFAVAAVSYYLVERPCLDLKHRFGEPRPCQPAASADLRAEHSAS